MSNRKSGQKMRAGGAKAYGILLAGILLASLFAPMYKLAMGLEAGLSTENIAFYRTAGAALILWLYCLCRAEKRQEIKKLLGEGKKLWQWMGFGLWRAMEMMLYAYGLEGGRVLFSTVLANSAPLFVMLFSYLFLREKTGKKALLGALTAMGGLALVAMQGGEKDGSMGSALLILASAAFNAGYLLMGKGFRTKTSAAVLMAGVFTMIALTQLILCLFSPEKLGPIALRGWWLLLAITLTCTLFGQMIVLYIVKPLPPATVSMAYLAGPVAAALYGFLFVGEMPAPLTMADGAVVLIGLGYYIRSAKEKAEKETSLSRLTKKPEKP